MMRGSPARAAGSGSTALTSSAWSPRCHAALRYRAHRADEGAHPVARGAKRQLLVASSVGDEAGISQATAPRSISLLEEVFLIKRIPAWSRNISTRVGRTPKVAFVDSGITASLLGADARSLIRPGGPFGALPRPLRPVAPLLLLATRVAEPRRALAREPAVVVLVVHDLAPLPEPGGQPAWLSLRSADRTRQP